METVLIAGGSGMIGSELEKMLANKGYEVLILSRNRQLVQSKANYIHWDVSNGQIDERFNFADHLINLCGAGIADKRWTSKRKKTIISSRIEPLQLLINKSKEYNKHFKSIISASAIGYYGDGGDELLKEDTPVQTKEFLSDVCVLWEDQAKLCESITSKLSIVRIGTVLGKGGGALAKMAMTIPYGVANFMGNGRQYMSWIHISDMCKMMIYLIEGNHSGIFNAVAPQPIRNKEFTEILQKTINPKSVLLPAPAIGLKLALGEMSRVVLNSSNVSSEKISASGFEFMFPDVESALSEIYR